MPDNEQDKGFDFDGILREIRKQKTENPTQKVKIEDAEVSEGRISGKMRVADLEKIAPVSPLTEHLLSAEEMRPYVEIIKAHYLKDSAKVKELMAELATRPLPEHYINRITAALGYAFEDYDSASVMIDRATLSNHDLEAIASDLPKRIIQMALYTTALLNAETMEKYFTRAIDIAKRNATEASLDAAMKGAFLVSKEKA